MAANERGECMKRRELILLSPRSYRCDQVVAGRDRGDNYPRSNNSRRIYTRCDIAVAREGDIGIRYQPVNIVVRRTHLWFRKLTLVSL